MNRQEEIDEKVKNFMRAHNGKMRAMPDGCAGLVDFKNLTHLSEPTLEGLRDARAFYGRGEVGFEIVKTAMRNHYEASTVKICSFTGLPLFEPSTEEFQSYKLMFGLNTGERVRPFQAENIVLNGKN